MALLKQIAILMLIGFVVGATLSTLIAPSVLEWYNTGAEANAGLCNCTKLARDVTSSFIRSQLIGGIIGAVFLTAAGIIISRMRASKRPPATPPAATPSV